MATAKMKADPLNVLRHYNIHKLEFEEDEQHFVFGEFAFTKKAKTAIFHYVVDSVPGENVTKVKEYYTLECLVFLMKHVAVPHPQYVRLALSLKVPTIRRPDRKAILSYLNGDMTSASSIDENGPPMEFPTLVNRTVDGRKMPAKKIRLPEETTLRKRMRSLLSVPTEAETEAVGRRSLLTDVLSAEQIAAIKAKAAKRLAKRKKLMGRWRTDKTIWLDDV